MSRHVKPRKSTFGDTRRLTYSNRLKLTVISLACARAALAARPKR
jgi:hypothetical protein